MKLKYIVILFVISVSLLIKSAISANYSYINNFIIQEQYQKAINSIIEEAKIDGYNNELKRITLRIEKLIELDKKVYRKVDIYGNDYLQWYKKNNRKNSKTKIIAGALLTAFIAYKVTTFLNGRSEAKLHRQSDGIISNVYADKNSTGKVRNVCFYFNNAHELDMNDRLIIQHKERNNLKTDTKGILGDSCINGKDIGGRYVFTYITENKVKTGEFYISGNHKNIDVDLSDFFLDNDITIHERD